jgi:hypothetical protein
VNGVNTGSGLMLGGPLKITAASEAADNVTLIMARLAAAKPSKIALGEGGSATVIDDSVFSGFAYDGGGGIDLVEIDLLNAGIVTTFRGPAVILLGDGDDVLNIGTATPLGKADFQSTAKFDGGSGTNTLTNAGNLFIAGQPVVLNF